MRGEVQVLKNMVHALTDANLPTRMPHPTISAAHDYNNPEKIPWDSWDSTEFPSNTGNIPPNMPSSSFSDNYMQDEAPEDFDLYHDDPVVMQRQRD
jgi:hypothetical protein